MAKLTPNNTYEAILAGEAVTPTSRDQAFIKEAIDNASGGSSLPSVTSDDNGDVLTVVEGVWAKAEAPTELPDQTGASQGDVLAIGSSGLEWATPSGGAEIYSVAITYDESYPEIAPTADKRVSEILAAYQDGKICECHIDHLGADFTLSLCGTMSGEMDAVIFSAVASVPNVGTECITFAGFGGDPSDEWSKYILPVQTGLPTPSFYDFDFTVTVDQQDPTAYVCTPASGVTFQAITEALAVTPNVYVKATLPTGNTFHAVFSEIGATAVSATGLLYGGSNDFRGLRLRVQSDDSCDVVMVALAAAQ